MVRVRICTGLQLGWDGREREAIGLCAKKEVVVGQRRVFLFVGTVWLCDIFAPLTETGRMHMPSDISASKCGLSHPKAIHQKNQNATRTALSFSFPFLLIPLPLSCSLTKESTLTTSSLTLIHPQDKSHRLQQQCHFPGIQDLVSGSLRFKVDLAIFFCFWSENMLFWSANKAWAEIYIITSPNRCNGKIKVQSKVRSLSF